MDIERLKKIGSEWKKENLHRIYFNNLASIYGLSTSHYKTGNISSASLAGNHISNTRARGLLTTLNFGKIWFDVVDNQFHSKNLPDDMATEIIEEIKKQAEVQP